MNLDTADHHVSFEALRALAEQLAAAIGGSPLRGVEIALTLPVKESADAALERLLVHAATPAHNGRLAAVHLVSEDVGLRENIAAYLGAKYQQAKKEGVISWSFVGTKKPTSRKARKPGVHALRDDEPAHPHIAVDAPELVAQLGRNLVDVPQGSSLHEVAVAASTRPALLTQLGLTTRSLRGVERLGQLAEGVRPSLSPLNDLDGVEFCRGSLSNGEYSEARPSTLGPGAVRLDAPAGTLATRLPTAVVLAVPGPLPAHAGRLDDRTIVERVDDAALRDAATVQVELSSDGRVLKAEVHRGFQNPLACWWRTSTKTESKLRMGGGVLSLRALVKVDARCAVDRENASVFLQAPFEGSVWATVDPSSDDIVPGKVGTVPVACLLRAQRKPGPARVTPIQRVSSAFFKVHFAKHIKHFRYLRRLPLMVSA